MLRVLIDTNILLSGLFFEGNEEKILNAFRLGKIQLIIPEHVLTEAKRNIQKKGTKLGNQEEALRTLESIIQNAKIVPISTYYSNFEKAKEMIRDPEDAPILAAVLSAEHDYFVSGDKDFQVLGLPTHVSTRELLNKIKTEPENETI